MSVIIVLLIIDTVAQLIFCHFSLWWLIQLICRAVFCLRVIGATFKVKTLLTIELFTFGFKVIMNFLFKGDNGMPWLNIGLMLLFMVIAYVLEFLDEVLYVYTIEDVDDVLE